jgi:hypothetical protein
MTTGYLDLLVLGVYLVGVVVFGLWVGRHQKDAADYLARPDAPQKKRVRALLAGLTR